MNFYKKLTIVFSMLFCITLFSQGPGGGERRQGSGRDQQRGGRPDASEILSMLDTNNDSVIDKEEAAKDKRGKISEDFDEIDTNDDELIDLDELEASLSNRKKPIQVSPEKLIEQIDDDSNGKLNKLEVAAAGNKELSEKFSEIDTNEDTELDIDELSVYYENREKPKKRRKIRANNN